MRFHLKDVWIEMANIIEERKEQDPDLFLDEVPFLERELALEMLSRFNGRQLMEMEGVCGIIDDDNNMLKEAHRRLKERRLAAKEDAEKD